MNCTWMDTLAYANLECIHGILSLILAVILFFTFIIICKPKF